MSGNWLDDFVEYASFGETPPRIMRWVGISTIASVLRRKVFIDQEIFQWSPNFYVLLVAPPGEVMKSTSMQIGLDLLKFIVDENGDKAIDFGAQMSTWQQLIQHMEEAKRTYILPDGEVFEASCTTVALSEMGLLFDPDDAQMITALTDMWDGRIGEIIKETKTSGTNIVVNPWINLFGCTTPEWVAKNFSTGLIGEGFGSRLIYLYAEQGDKFIAYPKEQNATKAALRGPLQDSLVQRLQEMANYSGPFQMTKAAIDWGTSWYTDYRIERRKLPRQLVSLTVRKQTQLHKVAMVLSCAKGKFPVIDVEELEEALELLVDVEKDAMRIFGFVGQSAEQKLVDAVLDYLRKRPQVKQTALMQALAQQQFELSALKGVLQTMEEAGYITREGSTANPTIRLVETAGAT